MDFFPEEAEQNENNEIANEKPERLDLTLLAIGKRTGLSFVEMNELRVRDLLAYADIYIGKKEKKSRMATQEDIDRFFS
jgi:hypothetical protein